MAPSRSLGVRRLNTLTKKVSYGRMPRRIIVVGVSREHLSIVYRGKEAN